MKCKCRIISYKGRFKKWWDILNLILAIFNSIFMPIAFAFDPIELKHILFVTFDSLVDVIFLIDFILMFRTSFKNRKGIEIRKCRKIAKNYIITTTFWFDLFSLLGAFWFNVIIP